MKWALTAALATSAALALLTACDNGPSAVATAPQAAGTQMATRGESIPTAPTSDRRETTDRRDDPVGMVDGRPMWSASRRYSAEENARRAFERNGEAFGARSMDSFVKKAHAFVQHPPSGTLTLTRANGDVLLYDPKGNVFAVTNKAGAPRTMFKPEDGMAYWEQQKSRESRRLASRERRNADDET
jgi:pyocin large subunit-like protein